MTVYVDKLKVYGDRGRWCHMLAEDFLELHQMANHIGLPRAYFQGDHYDLGPSKRRLAIEAGAVETTSRHLVEIRRKARLNWDMRMQSLIESDLAQKLQAVAERPS